MLQGNASFFTHHFHFVSCVFMFLQVPSRNTCKISKPVDTARDSNHLLINNKSRQVLCSIFCFVFVVFPPAERSERLGGWCCRFWSKCLIQVIWGGGVWRFSNITFTCMLFKEIHISLEFMCCIFILWVIV